MNKSDFCGACFRKVTQAHVISTYIPSNGDKPIPYILCSKCALKLLHSSRTRNCILDQVEYNFANRREH